MALDKFFMSCLLLKWALFVDRHDPGSDVCYKRVIKGLVLRLVDQFLMALVLARRVRLDQFGYLPRQLDDLSNFRVPIFDP